MVKVVMSKALPVKFASDAATASLAHMAFGKTSTDAPAAAASAVAAAAHAAATAKTSAAAAASTSASTAVSKRIAGDASAC